MDAEPRTPPHTRLILAADDLLAMMGTRTEDGRRLSFEWGEQQPGGWYEPVITATDDGKVMVDRAELDRLQEAEARADTGLDAQMDLRSDLIDAIALGIHKTRLSNDAPEYDMDTADRRAELIWEYVRPVLDSAARLGEGRE